MIKKHANVYKMTTVTELSTYLYLQLLFFLCVHFKVFMLDTDNIIYSHQLLHEIQFTQKVYVVSVPILRISPLSCFYWQSCHNKCLEALLHHKFYQPTPNKHTRNFHRLFLPYLVSWKLTQERYCLYSTFYLSPFNIKYTIHHWLFVHFHPHITQTI